MIPDFQHFMLPVLTAIKAADIIKSTNLREQMSTVFKLTSAEIEELLPSGVNAFVSRIHWAITYLKKAGLIKTPMRGQYQITEAGKKVLLNPPAMINVKYLKSYPEFNQWMEKSNSKNKSTESSSESIESIEEKTPDELIETSHQKINELLRSEIIEKIKSCSPRFFEALVVDLLIKMGYGGSRADAGRVLGKSHDGGIDGLIKEDRLGLDTIYLQAKRWEGAVPSSQVRDFAGSLLGKKAKKGIFITTSNFPKQAYDFVNGIEHKIVLIDGSELADLMIQHNVGVSISRSYEIKKIDLDYFEDE